MSATWNTRWRLEAAVTTSTRGEPVGGVGRMRRSSERAWGLSAFFSCCCQTIHIPSRLTIDPSSWNSEEQFSFYVFNSQAEIIEISLLIELMHSFNAPDVLDLMICFFLIVFSIFCCWFHWAPSTAWNWVKKFHLLKLLVVKLFPKSCSWTATVCLRFPSFLAKQTRHHFSVTSTKTKCKSLFQLFIILNAVLMSPGLKLR